MLVAMSKRLASHGGHSKILRDPQLRKLSRAGRVMDTWIHVDTQPDPVSQDTGYYGYNCIADTPVCAYWYISGIRDTGASIRIQLRFTGQVSKPRSPASHRPRVAVTTAALRVP